MNSLSKNAALLLSDRSWFLTGLCGVLVAVCCGCLQAPTKKVSLKPKEEPEVTQNLEPNAEDVARLIGQLGGRIVRNSSGSVRYVVLTDLAVGDEALESIDKLEDLEVLGLNGTRVSDFGMRKLQGLRRLTYLFLNGTNVSDQGLLTLAENPALRYISMDNTNLSPKAVKEFHRLSPGTLVQHSSRVPGSEEFYNRPNHSTLANKPQAEDFLRNPAAGFGTASGGKAAGDSEAQGNVVLRYRQD